MEDTAIYFIQAEHEAKLIKIGYTCDIHTRFNALQKASPVKLQLILLINGNAIKEHSLHELFAQHRKHGEWFAPAEEILKFIEKNKHGEIVIGPKRKRNKNKSIPTQQSDLRNNRDEEIIKKLRELKANETPVDLYMLSNALTVKYNTLYYWLYGDKTKRINGLINRNKNVIVETRRSNVKSRVTIKLLD